MKALSVKERNDLLNQIINNPYIIERVADTKEVINLKTLLEEDPCKVKEIVGKILGYVGKIGSGVYGEVFEISCDSKVCLPSNSLVLKSTAYDKDFVEDPRTNENAEVEILKSLQSFLQEGQTPHLPILLADFTCKDKKRYIVTERAVNDLYHLRNKPIFRDPIAVRAILFQMVWTLAIIHNRYPYFRHNDLHFKNILYIDGPTTGYTKYVWDADHTFYVPNVGIRIILWDFGMSCISPQIQNLATYDPFFNVLGISSTRNQSIDMFNILSSIWYGGILANIPRQHPVRILLKKFIFDVLGTTELSKIIIDRRLILDKEVMSSQEILFQPFFEGLLIPQLNVTDIYIKYNSTIFTPPILITSQKYNITCSAFQNQYFPLKDDRYDIYHRNKCEFKKDSGLHEDIKDIFSIFVPGLPEEIKVYLTNIYPKVYRVVAKEIKESTKIFEIYLMKLVAMYTTGLSMIKNNYALSEDRSAQIDYLLHITGMSKYLWDNAIPRSTMMKDVNIEYAKKVHYYNR